MTTTTATTTTKISQTATPISVLNENWWRHELVETYNEVHMQSQTRRHVYIEFHGKLNLFFYILLCVFSVVHVHVEFF